MSHSDYPQAFHDADDSLSLQLEMRRLFREQPVVVAHRSQWPEGANFVTTWLAGMPLLVVKDSAQAPLKAFINVCPHRGAILVEDAAGQAEVFECRHHGWRFGPGGEACGTLEGGANLQRVAVTCRDGLVWACMQPQIGDGDGDGRVGSLLPIMPSELAMATRVVTETTTASVQQPWKRVVWEAAETGLWLAPNIVVKPGPGAGWDGDLVMIEVIPMLAGVCQQIDRRLARTDNAPPSDGCGKQAPQKTPPDDGREAFLRAWTRTMAS